MYKEQLWDGNSFLENLSRFLWCKIQYPWNRPKFKILCDSRNNIGNNNSFAILRYGSFMKDSLQAKIVDYPNATRF